MYRFKRITTFVYMEGLILPVYIENVGSHAAFVIAETDGPACRIDYGNLWG